MGMARVAWSMASNVFAETKPISLPLAHISHLTQIAIWRAPEIHHTCAARVIESLSTTGRVHH
jgi:hypothetical protein